MRRYVFIILSLLCSLVASPVGAVQIDEVTAPKTGIRAWLVEDHKLPIIALRFSFRGGSEQDPLDKQGLTNLTVNALTEGAGDYSATAFQEELADHSIALTLSAGRDEIEGGVKCLAEDHAYAFDLLRLALTKPRFETKDIERLRAQQLAGIRQQIADPNWQARYELFSEIFAGHPYGQRHLGSTQTLASITREDIKSFAAQHLAQDNIVVAVAGDISPAELAAALDKIFGALPAHAVLSPLADVKSATFAPTLIKREGTQTSLMFALPGPRRADPDWYASEIANYILGGGGFSSRLMQDVRDKRGLTYGIQTGLAPSEHSGLIIGQAAVDNPKVSEALTVIRDTMQRFHDEGLTEHEIGAAKDFLSGSKPLALTSTDKIAAILVDMQREHLGRDYLDRYGDIIRGVRKEDIERAIDRWFDPAKMTLVMVGKPDPSLAFQSKDMVRQ